MRDAARTLRMAMAATGVAAIVALGLVWWAEHVQGMVPCELCLIERWPWRVLLVLGVVGVFAPRPRLVRGVAAVSVATLGVGVGLAVLHGGVEQGWWPSPLPQCHAPHITGRTFAERFASMPLRPAKPCDAPSYLLPAVPVSMTVMGGIAAAALIGLLAAAAFRDASAVRARTGS